MHPAVGRNPNSFALQFPSQENGVLHSGCPCVLAWQESDVFQAYNFAFQVVFFAPICFSSLCWADDGSYKWSSAFLGTDSQG